MWLFDQILPNKNPWGHLIDISTTESILGLKTNQQNTTPKLVTPKKLITVGASDRTDGRGSETAKMVPIHCISLTLRSICCSQYHQLYYTCCYMTFQSVFLLQDICNTQKYCIILSNFPELFKPPLLFLQCRTSCQSFPNPEDGCPRDTGKFLDFKNKKKIWKSKKENPHTAQLHLQTTLCSARYRSEETTHPDLGREGNFCTGMEQVTRVSSTTTDKPDKVHLPQHQALS